MLCSALLHHYTQLYTIKLHNITLYDITHLTSTAPYTTNTSWHFTPSHSHHVTSRHATPNHVTPHHTHIHITVWCHVPLYSKWSAWLVSCAFFASYHYTIFMLVVSVRSWYQKQAFSQTLLWKLNYVTTEESAPKVSNSCTQFHCVQGPIFGKLMCHATRI